MLSALQIHVLSPQPWELGLTTMWWEEKLRLSEGRGGSPPPRGGHSLHSLGLSLRLVGQHLPGHRGQWRSPLSGTPAHLLLGLHTLQSTQLESGSLFLTDAFMRLSMQPGFYNQSTYLKYYSDTWRKECTTPRGTDAHGTLPSRVGMEVRVRQPGFLGNSAVINKDVLESSFF